MYNPSANSTGMTLAAGSRLGPYEIISLVGAGGMGEVYRAHDARLQRNVAIKILPPGFVASQERQVQPADTAGIEPIDGALMTRDGNYYVYGACKELGNLFVVRGLE